MLTIPIILFEDDALLIVEKPAKVPCLREKDGISPTIADLFTHYLPSLDLLPDNGLAHRLDNDTSGLLVVAKTAEVFDNLRHQFSSGAIKKEYTALVLGHPPQTGTITAPIAHHPRKGKKMVVCSSEKMAHDLGARLAKTSYVVKEFYRQQGNLYALLCITIGTGVRHQIRAHMASIGHPLVGDRLYQNPKKRALDIFSLDRSFLHASRFVLGHPITGDQLEFTSNLPGDLKTVLGTLKHTTWRG